MAIANKVKTKKKPGNPNWKKGGPSPNPTGRPRDTLTPHLREIAATGKGREVAEQLFKEAINGNIQACAILLDRLDGKPRQSIDVTTGRGAELQAIVNELVALGETEESAKAFLAQYVPEVTEWTH